MKLLYILPILLKFGVPLYDWELVRFFNEKSSLGIINGNKTSIKDYPYMVSIMAYGHFLGSGVIVNSNWVLTTAYNAAFFQPEKLVLRVGSSNYNKSGQVLEVQDIVYPTKYKGDNYDWNLAVLKVKQPILFGNKTQPVKIANRQLTNGTKVVLVGWGPTTNKSSAPPSKTLVTAEVMVLGKKSCSTSYKLTPRVMCTFISETGPTAYDWGDPLIINGTVYGLYSQRFENNPYLYTDISSLHKWITKHTNL